MIRNGTARAVAIATLVGAITASACSLFTGPKSQPVTISVTSDTIIAALNTSANVTWLEFTVPISIHNGGSTGMPIDFCMASVLAANGSVAWSPICFVDGPSTLPMLASGETGRFQLRVNAAISGAGAPKWGSQTVNGTYRLRLALGAEAVFVSNPFAISELTTSVAAVKFERPRVAARFLPSASAEAVPNPGAAARR